MQLLKNKANTSRSLTNPKVIGFVPAYNSENFLFKTLEALADQTYQNFEIWICDDASTDGTAQVCKDFCERDPRFKLFQNEQNQGWWNNSIRFWKACAEVSDYCFFQPHDDIPELNFIWDQVELLEQNPFASLCVPGIKNTYPNGDTSQTIHKQIGTSEEVSKRIIPLINMEIPYWWAAYHGIHRSQYISKVLPVNPLRFGEKEFALDLIWLIKLTAMGPFVCSEHVLFEKHYSEKSLSGQWQYSFKNRSAVFLAIAEEVTRMAIPFSEKSAILRAILKKIFASLLNKIPFT